MRMKEMYKNGIYGAVIGDICGSLMEIYEMRNRKEAPNLQLRQEVLKSDYNLFNEKMFYTDDTILTAALCDAVLNEKDYEKYIKYYGRAEILSIKEGERNKFGQMFTEWCKGAAFRESYGNGCAMRISPIAFEAKSIYDLEKEVTKATVCTHNHPDSIKCAMATAKAIYHAKSGAGKAEIEVIIDKTLGRKLNFNLEKLQKEYTFTAKAIDSVPQALFCFLKARDFEETIKFALSIGGDTDTNAAIAASVAGAYYGISDDLVRKAESYLNPTYKRVLSKSNEHFKEINNEKEL